MSVIRKIQGAVGGAFVSSALFLMPGYVDAMEIKQFDQMTSNDRGRYVEALFGQTVKLLVRHGRHEDNDKVLALFQKGAPGGTSKGIEGLFNSINGLRKLENEGRLVRVPHIEHAMALMLKDYGIVIPFNELMHFAKDFKPQDEDIAQDKAPSKPHSDP